MKSGALCLTALYFWLAASAVAPPLSVAFGLRQDREKKAGHHKLPSKKKLKFFKQTLMEMSPMESINRHPVKDSGENSLSQSVESFSVDHKGFTALGVFALAFWGCLARILTDFLFRNVESYGTTLSVSFFSNMVGCFILGALGASPLDKTTIPFLFTGLTTGFCGSYTTFSGWNLQILKTIQQGNVIYALTNLLVGGAFFLESYRAGKNCWCILEGVAKGPTGDYSGKAEGAPLLRARTAILAAGAVAAGALTLFVALLGAGAGGAARRHWRLACLLAPAGALCRWRLGGLLNGRAFWGGRLPAWLPAGTLAANASGAALLAALAGLAPRAGGGGWAAAALAAAGTGFCSSYTTYSTFAAEVDQLAGSGVPGGKARAAAYFFGTCAAALALSAPFLAL